MQLPQAMIKAKAKAGQSIFHIVIQYTTHLLQYAPESNYLILSEIKRI